MRSLPRYLAEWQMRIRLRVLRKQLDSRAASSKAFIAESAEEHFLKEGIMQMVITFMAVVAGLIFSVAVALLAEEFIFGQVFRLFFGRQALRQTIPQAIPETKQKR